MSGFLMLILYGPLLLGNIYKLCGLTGWLMDYVERPVEWPGRLLTVLRRLYWVSPLSWLNPYAGQLDKGLGLKVMICVVGSVICALVGILGYRNRRL